MSRIVLCACRVDRIIIRADPLRTETLPDSTSVYCGGWRICDTSGMLLCMRTTIELSDELARKLKSRAAAEGKSLKQVIEKTLRSHVTKRAGRSDYALRWRTERGRLLPGVRLEDRDHFFDLMEGRE
jgi:predicted transcriptional regulator